MTLRIVKAVDPITVEQIVVCIYGQPGVWKSSLGNTADSPLIFDFDHGLYRTRNRRDSVQVSSWLDVANLTADDLTGYKTAVVDTAGRALDIMTADIIKKDPKAARGGGQLTLQGFGTLKAQFTAWLKFLRSFGMDVVLLAHSDEQKNGDDVNERLDIQGGSKNEIFKSSDAMARLTIRNGKRVLIFSPTDTAFGKNPANLEALEVPDLLTTPTYLGDLIGGIKAKLNEMTAEQTEVSALLGEWAGRVCEATTAAQMTDLIPEIVSLDPRITDNAKRLLVSWAKDRGIVFDKAAAKFTEKEAEKVGAVA